MHAWPAPDEGALASVARAVTQAIRDDANVWGRLRELLSVAQLHTPVSVALERLAVRLEGVVEALLVDAIQEDDEHLAAVREFFLDPRESYSAGELAMLWRIDATDVSDICHDRIVLWELCGGAVEDLRIPWADAVETTLTYNLIRPFDVERALAGEFVLARAERWWTVPVVVRIPRFVASVLMVGGATAVPAILAQRIEQMILEFSTTEYGNPADEGFWQ